jgi:hypothetical protein
LAWPENLPLCKLQVALFRAVFQDFLW